MKYSIGIDIGKNGAIVIQNVESGEIESFVMPTISNQLNVKAIFQILEKYKNEDCMVAFENVNAIFGSSAGATFTFGFVAGCTEAIVIALGIPFVKVSPKEWQKSAFKGVQVIRRPSTINKKGKEIQGKVETKAMALIACQRLYPNYDTRATQRSKNAHDGIVDALLISWWIIQTYK